MLDELQTRSKQAYVSPYFFAIIYSGLDEKAAALDGGNVRRRSAPVSDPARRRAGIFGDPQRAAFWRAPAPDRSPAERDRPAMMTACTSPRKNCSMIARRTPK